ncbi:hypothetical protein Ahy_B09g097652 isoform D [Arachis hypogaea]|uniref:Uncharacterized protein n=1 Tax=Arachis hypogaea TaxID=3818 RepID=A0A444XPL1_ARAHY|nr:hypothetical protein Ahy_B09g097652 isoform D [Arachis hypogaea]
MVSPLWSNPAAIVTSSVATVGVAVTELLAARNGAVAVGDCRQSCCSTSVILPFIVSCRSAEMVTTCYLEGSKVF